MLKIVVAVVVNSALLPYAVGELTSGYGDFNRKWFTIVGAQVSYPLVYRSLTVSLSFMAKLPIVMIAIYAKQKAPLTRKEVTDMLIGPEWELNKRYSFLVATFYTAMVFSIGFPILWMSLFLCFFLLYFVDKFLLLRLFRKPPYYSQLIHETTLNAMCVGMVIHSIVSVVMLGATEIFGTKVEDCGYSEGSSCVSKGVTGGERFGSYYGAMYISLMVLYLLAVIWNIFLADRYIKFKDVE